MRLLLSIILLTVLSVTACSTPTPAPQTSDPAEGYPLDTRTGIQDVDSVLTAVASGNPQELIALINYTVAPCTNAEGFGGPPKCGEAEAEGTQLDVLPILGSEGGFIRKNEIGNWQGIDVTALYAVYRVSGNALNEEYYPAGEYIAFFVPQENQTGVALRIANGGIVRVDYLFDVFPDSLRAVIERDTSEVILAPKSR